MTVFSLPAAFNHYLSCIVARAASTRIVDMATSGTQVSTAAVPRAAGRLYVAICLVVIFVCIVVRTSTFSQDLLLSKMVFALRASGSGARGCFGTATVA
jgi:hypothetical protein